MNIGVGLFGCGTVGTGVAEIVATRREWLKENHDITLKVRHIVVRDLTRERAAVIERELLRTLVLPAVHDSDVDVVVEVIGGTDVAGDVVRTALRDGKHVVTANKALIAKHGSELEIAAERAGVLLRYEAAVGGAIPILQTLRNALPGSRITGIRGILNGTTNYILTRMAEDGLPFFRALAKATDLGYAEADPRADVTGTDAAQKLIILTRQAFGTWLSESQVARIGIDNVSLIDIGHAHEAGCTIKSVAEASFEEGKLVLSVKPIALPNSDPLATVRNELNAVEFQTDFAGPLLLQGRGAGGRATANAVYSDIVEAALTVKSGRRQHREAAEYVHA
jgi:homoserine dehydrogenase